MITVFFDEKNEYARAAGLWQWDYGQVLRIQGLTLPTAVEIHFSLTETGGQAITRVGVTRDGVTEVVIPDSMLENGPAAGSQYTIYAWLYLTDSTSGQTIRRISLQVRTRSKPEPFDTPEAEELFRRAIDTVNEAVKKAEDIGTGAETAAGEAKTAASEAGKSLKAVQRLADQVQLDADAAAQDKIAVEKIAAQAQESAFMAGLSEQSARTSETAAKQAQAGAEAAEDASRQHAEAAEEDRMEVSEARKAVEQAVANIVADRELIQQNAKDLADVKNELTEKADVIVESANGNGYCMPDSADEPLRSLRILGKSTQNGDPSPESPVPIVNAGGKGNIGIKIEGKNLIPESEIRLDPFLKRAFLKGYLLKAGVTYTLSTKGIVSGIYFNNVGETEKIAYAYEAKSVTYTPNVDILTTLRVWDDGSHMSDLKDYYIQLEVGDTATGYEPYKTPQNLTVQTPNGLLGIPVKSGGNYTDHDGRRWICDEIDYGQSVYIRRIGKTVVDGENIKFTASADENYWNLPSKSSPGIISGGIISAFFKTGIFPANITNQFIFVKKESISSHFATVDELNAFCVQKNTEGTPVEFYYMANPIETPLSPEDIAAYKQLHTNYPTTIILNDENADIDVAYVADTKNYIQKRENIMQKQLSDIQAALISQKISGGGVKVTDSLKMPLKNLRLCGRSSQVVTTGAQLFDIGKATPHADSYGLKISIDGRQRVKIKGTAESEHSTICFNILNYDNFDLSGKSYKIKIFNLRGTHSIQEIYGLRTKNEKSIAVVIDVSSKKNVDITFQIMVSKEEPTKWEPYTGGKPAPSPVYPQKISDAGNDGNIVAKIEGKNLIDIESGIVAGWNINLPELKLIPGETYSLTNVNVPVNIALVEETTNTRLTANYIASGRKDTFIMPDIPDAKIFISGTNATWNKGDLSTVKIQLELGPAATEYEPYKPAQTLIVSTPDGLPGIPVSSGGNYTDENGQQWVTDEVDLTKGVYIKKIEKIASYNNESINGSYISETGELTVGARVLFVLDTSVETPLLPETIAAFRKLCMNYPVTTITNSDNCGMEVAYTADTKAYIDGKIAEISAAIVSK